MIYLAGRKRNYQIEIKRRLRKESRFLECEEGNRHPWLVARAYYAFLREEPTLAHWCRWKAQGTRGARFMSDRECDRVLTKTSMAHQRHWAHAMAAAARNAAHLPWDANGKLVLAMMYLFGHRTGLCCAAQETIGNALGLTRQCVNRWIGRLRKAGLIKLVGYDCRGGYLWKGKPRPKYCLIFAFVEPARVKTGCDTNTHRGAVGSGAAANKVHTKYKLCHLIRRRWEKIRRSMRGACARIRKKLSRLPFDKRN